MKNFKISPEVEAQLRAQVTQLHEFCVANGLHYVAGVLIENNEESVKKVVSAAITRTETDGPELNNMIAAVEFLKMDIPVPDEVLMALINRDEGGDDCQCEQCQSRRAADGAGAPSGVLH